MPFNRWQSKLGLAWAMQLEAKAGMGAVEPNSVGLAGSAPRFLPLLTIQKATPRLWISWDLSKGSFSDAEALG